MIQSIILHDDVKTAIEAKSYRILIDSDGIPILEREIIEDSAISGLVQRVYFIPKKSVYYSSTKSKEEAEILHENLFDTRRFCLSKIANEDSHEDVINKSYIEFDTIEELVAELGAYAVININNKLRIITRNIFLMDGKYYARKDNGVLLFSSISKEDCKEFIDSMKRWE